MPCSARRASETELASLMSLNVMSQGARRKLRLHLTFARSARCSRATVSDATPRSLQPSQPDRPLRRTAAPTINRLLPPFPCGRRRAPQAVPQGPARRRTGITKDQSSKWQKLAEIPEEKFGAVVAKKVEAVNASLEGQFRGDSRRSRIAACSHSTQRSRMSGFRWPA